MKTYIFVFLIIFKIEILSFGQVQYLSFKHKIGYFLKTNKEKFLIEISENYDSNIFYNYMKEFYYNNYKEKKCPKANIRYNEFNFLYLNKFQTIMYDNKISENLDTHSFMKCLYIITIKENCPKTLTNKDIAYLINDSLDILKNKKFDEFGHNFTEWYINLRQKKLSNKAKYETILRDKYNDIIPIFFKSFFDEVILPKNKINNKVDLDSLVFVFNNLPMTLKNHLEYTLRNFKDKKVIIQNCFEDCRSLKVNLSFSGEISLFDYCNTTIKITNIIDSLFKISKIQKYSVALETSFTYHGRSKKINLLTFDKYIFFQYTCYINNFIEGIENQYYCTSPKDTTERTKLLIHAVGAFFDKFSIDKYNIEIIHRRLSEKDKNKEYIKTSITLVFKNIFDELINRTSKN